MTPASTTPRTLSTADERREAVLEAAMGSFAARGVHGTPTTAVAKAAGISHAYLFRLYPTKTALAVAVAERCMARIHDRFAAVADEARDRNEAGGEALLQAMGMAYGDLLRDRSLLVLQLHAHAASADDVEIRAAMRAGWARLYDLVRRETGADEPTLQGFFAMGMLMNTMAALDAGAIDEPWANALADCAPDAE